MANKHIYRCNKCFALYKTKKRALECCNSTNINAYYVTLDHKRVLSD